MVLVGPIPEKRPILKPLTKTTPRLSAPNSPALRKVSVGVPEMVKTDRVRVGVTSEEAGAGELFHPVKLLINAIKLSIHLNYAY